jgi:hypothetical protein
MVTTNNNLPASPYSNSTIQAFDTYYEKPFEIDASTFSMMKGFFESRGFDKSSSETISISIMKQARLDGYNPLAVLDTMKSLQGVELSAVVGDIINYNRFKTSYLGQSTGFKPFEPVARNILT